MINDYIDQTPTLVLDRHFIDCSSNGLQRVILVAAAADDNDGNDVLQSNNSGLGGLEVACWPLVPKFAGSNPAEAVGFYFPSEEREVKPFDHMS